jgi:hypothetical protein
MASRKGILLGGCLGVMGVTALGCCGGTVAVWIWGPMVLAGAFLEDQPLAVAFPHPDPARSAEAADRIGRQLAESRTAMVTGDDLTALLLGDESSDDVQMRVVNDRADHAHLDMSIRTEDTPPRYVNIQVGGAFVLENGWFTHTTMDEIRVGDWDFGKYVAGQEMAQSMNQSMARERMENPDLGAKLDGIERLATENGGFSLKLNEQGYNALIASGSP